MKVPPSSQQSAPASQSAQRVKVGLIGLVAIMLLIAVANAIIGQTSRERPIETVGAAQPEVVANIALGNGDAAASEPMAELGVAPATANGSASAAK